MNDPFETDPQKRSEIVECFYWSLMNGWDIPQDIREHYGFSKDYELYRQLEDMDPEEYRQQRRKGSVPDILEVDARLTRAVEQVFERLCTRPPAAYLDRLHEEWMKLKTLEADPGHVENPFVTPSFLVRYGIDRSASDTVRQKQAQTACRKLEERMAGMTGKSKPGKRSRLHVRYATGSLAGKPIYRLSPNRKDAGRDSEQMAKQEQHHEKTRHEKQTVVQTGRLPGRGGNAAAPELQRKQELRPPLRFMEQCGRQAGRPYL